MSEPLWRPAPERVAASRMDAFRRFVSQRHALALADYAALHQWSVSAVADFWQAVAEFFAVDFSTPPQRVLDNADAMPGAQWFAGAELNFAAHLLRRRDDHPALVAISEDGQREQQPAKQAYCCEGCEYSEDDHSGGLRAKRSDGCACHHHHGATAL